MCHTKSICSHQRLLKEPANGSRQRSMLIIGKSLLRILIWKHLVPNRPLSKQATTASTIRATSLESVPTVGYRRRRNPNLIVRVFYQCTFQYHENSLGLRKFAMGRSSAGMRAGQYTSDRSWTDNLGCKFGLVKSFRPSALASSCGQLYTFPNKAHGYCNHTWGDPGVLL